MSSSAPDVVRITTGMQSNSGSFFISSNTSHPFFLGMFRSSRIIDGRAAPMYFPCRRRKGKGLFAVCRHAEIDADRASFQSLAGQLHIAGVVFRQQHLERLFGDSSTHLLPFARALARAGTVKKNVEPSPGCDSTQIRPPRRSTILLQMASPIPVPGYSVPVCSRWKIAKIRSRCSGVIPIPLSRTEKSHSDRKSV